MHGEDSLEVLRRLPVLSCSCSTVFVVLVVATAVVTFVSSCLVLVTLWMMW